MRVLKFGGSSVGHPERIMTILSIVKDKLSKGEQVCVVVSAFSGVTDQLIEMSQKAAEADVSYLASLHQFKERHHQVAQELLGKDYLAIKEEMDTNHDELKDLLKGIHLVREVSPRTMDYVLSFGERNSAFIISKVFSSNGILADYLDARHIIKTNKDFTSAKVNFKKTYPLIKGHFDAVEGRLQIMTGFIASDIGGLTTTLGRGGSDYSAAILAGGLDAEALEIWTDVDGVLTSDPRKVKKAFTIPSLSYAEAMEMSHFGAKVIYPPTIKPALDKDIPIYIKNTFNPTFTGTLIGQESMKDFPSIIKGVSSLNNVSLLRLQGSGMVGVSGISGRLFGALGKHSVNVILITQASSEHSICFAVNSTEVQTAVKALKSEFEKELDAGSIQLPDVENNMCIITVVGESMRKVPGVSGMLFSALGSNGVNINAIAQGSSELNISFVIDKNYEVKALNVIHDAFYMSDNRRVNLFIVGTGLIGKELLKQIYDQRDKLINKYKLELNVIALSNSRKMVLEEDGIDLSSWDYSLSNGQDANIDSFVQNMIDLNLPNSIFIDNTANAELPKHYLQILKANISIVTPNKVANSSSQAQYDLLKKTAAERKIHFRYETNVGAGLPVIATIQNMVNSGDNIHKIEAVLSGSLSYIFNNFDGIKPFSQLVSEARDLGYTEPDPRDDLSGMDVKRKIIILSREAGMSIEPSEVKVASILPEEVMNAKDVDDFFVQLRKHDAYFHDMISSAKAKGCVLRFLASTALGNTEVSLQELGQDHPFFNLESSDNMFVISSDRYAIRPLIIRGPGAGAQVTAGGVFADILMIAQ